MWIELIICGLILFWAVKKGKEWGSDKKYMDTLKGQNDKEATLEEKVDERAAVNFMQHNN